jgi:hypothetical protein
LAFIDIILDLDLDFFGWPVFRSEPDQPRLPLRAWKHVARPEDVRAFMERQCSLSIQTPLPGHESQEHVDAFTVWRTWLDRGQLSNPFAVVHVDAHSDLGSGVNRSCTYIEAELLSLPLTERRFPLFDQDHLNSENYLLGVIANRWMRHLTYVYPANPAPAADSDLDESEIDEEPPVPDLPAWIFRKDSWKTGLIELSHRAHDRCLPSDEPPVEFKLVEANAFSLNGFTHMFLARSPAYTTSAADELLPIIREYFRQT